MNEPHHAGCVARLAVGTWSGVLLTGPSGVGKSDLMLRLLERGWSLVADDRVRLWSSAGRLYGAPPTSLAGLLEARCVNVTRRRYRAFARVALLVECVAPATELERVAEPSVRIIERVSVPTLRLRPLEGSAPAKVALALAEATRSGLARRAF